MPTHRPQAGQRLQGIHVSLAVAMVPTGLVARDRPEGTDLFVRPRHRLAQRGAARSLVDAEQRHVLQRSTLETLEVK
jgi:hypothetical protein